ncbi:hypothetical protein CEXT_157331 [Caerostris extrusa]|uniref:Uncharacterized protein n=1 Tax=Caerostris extrusa TaxID=172846 RepID=A0AAV4NEJ1_CAEEX|nr:hypothetical protein CEXT_157331 [Caerostris extrusa]
MEAFSSPNVPSTRREDDTARSPPSQTRDWRTTSLSTTPFPPMTCLQKIRQRPTLTTTWAVVESAWSIVGSEKVVGQLLRSLADGRLEVFDGVS